MKLGRFWLTQECGQRWYRISSWRSCSSRGRKITDVRTGKSTGYAFGPIMLFWRKS